MNQARVLFPPKKRTELSPNAADDQGTFGAGEAVKLGKSRHAMSNPKQTLVASVHETNLGTKLGTNLKDDETLGPKGPPRGIGRAEAIAPNDLRPALPKIEPPQVTERSPANAQCQANVLLPEIDHPAMVNVDLGKMEELPEPTIAPAEEKNGRSSRTTLNRRETPNEHREVKGPRAKDLRETMILKAAQAEVVAHDANHCRSKTKAIGMHAKSVSRIPMISSPNVSPQNRTRTPKKPPKLLRAVAVDAAEVDVGPGQMQRSAPQSV
jgi:hypothetical protein